MTLHRLRQVEFQYAATFTGNEVLRGDADYNQGGGGAVAVGALHGMGNVIFHDFAYFTGNQVRSGGRGGGMENLGTAYFSRASYFRTNFVGGERLTPLKSGW